MKKIKHPIFILTSASPSFAYASNMGGPGDFVAFLVILLVGLVLSFFMSFKREKEGELGKFNALKFFGYVVLAFIFALLFGLLVWLN